MKKFRFGLDSVLDYRRQVLDSCQGEYAQALDQVRQQETRKAEVEDRYRQLNQEFRDAAAAGITAADALAYEGGLRLLEMEINRESKLLEEYRRTAEEKRERMMQAHIDKAALERLREKKWQDYNKEVQKSDELFIDELVSARRGAAG